MRSEQIRKMTTLAMLSALAFLLTVIFYIMPIPPFVPAAPFLNYEPKDVIFVISGFIFGPLAVVPMAIIVSVLEMPFSGTQAIGLVMNIMASCAFACPAAFVYQKRRTLAGAVIGLISGVLSMTAVMLLWNFLLTPIFIGIPRDAVTAMLVPVFLPFNLIKGGLNAAAAMILYKPIKEALSKSRLMPGSSDKAVTRQSKAVSVGILLISLFVIITCVMFILAMQGVI